MFFKRLTSFSPILCLALILVSTQAQASSGESIFNRQCTQCHSAQPPAEDATASPNQAPNLSYAGNKFNRAWLSEWLQNPTVIHPGGNDYLNHIAVVEGRDKLASTSIHRCPSSLSDTEAAAVSDYLMTLKRLDYSPPVIDSKKRYSKRKALQLFRKQQACAACHAIHWGKRVIGGVSGPNLTNAGNRLQPAWIYSYIKNPQHWQPQSSMPRVALSDKKLTLLTGLILSMQQPAELDHPKPKYYSHSLPVQRDEFITASAGQKFSEARLYRRYCVQCHGSQGNGKGINESAGALSVSPKVHIDPVQMSKISDKEIQQGISGGGDAVDKSALMPPWGKTLSTEQIKALAAYLRHLCQCSYSPE